MLAAAQRLGSMPGLSTDGAASVKLLLTELESGVPAAALSTLSNLPVRAEALSVYLI